MLVIECVSADDRGPQCSLVYLYCSFGVIHKIYYAFSKLAANDLFLVT